MGGSFIGPASNLLDTEASWVKTQWTYALRFLYCSILVFIEAACTKNYRKKVREIKKVKIIGGILVTPLLQCFWTFGLIYGADNLIQSHAYVCNCLFGIFIVLIGYCLCLKPYKLEIAGLVLTMAGVACLFSDSSAQRADGKTGNLLSYSICVFCALFAAFFFLINGILVKAVPVFLLCQL